MLHQIKSTSGPLHEGEAMGTPPPGLKHRLLGGRGPGVSAGHLCGPEHGIEAEPFPGGGGVARHVRRDHDVVAFHGHRPARAMT